MRDYGPFPQWVHSIVNYLIHTVGCKVGDHDWFLLIRVQDGDKKQRTTGHVDRVSLGKIVLGFTLDLEFDARSGVCFGCRWTNPNNPHNSRLIEDAQYKIPERPGMIWCMCDGMRVSPWGH